jgi:predicted ArsR family transcriptional regulator
VTDWSEDIGIDRHLLRLARDPARLNVLRLLSERTCSAAEVAAELGIEEGAATRRIEEMREEGLVEVAGETLRGEAAASHYRATVRTIWQAEEWEELSHEERRELVRWTLRVINADANEALNAGTLAVRTEEHVSRTVSVVDERGWLELARIQDDAMRLSFAVQAESAERLAESGEEGMTVMSTMLCFEMPARRPDPS